MNKGTSSNIKFKVIRYFISLELVDKGGGLMPTTTQDELLKEEERLKEEVYRKFDEMTSSATSSVRARQDDITQSSFDDKEAFMVHGELSSARKHRHEVAKLVGKLYDSPYFAHVVVSLDDNPDDKENYFLSDCESLEQIVIIGNNAMLLPFKQNKDRPISGALFHCYQAKKGDPISYKGPRGDEFVLVPQLICNTEIWKKKLKDVIRLYPQMDVSQITADELLELKLQENRNNPTFKNIISTLQQKQFEIIATDTKKSFVVQGCAGSGKSQCMLHRLFFLRDVLAQDGWDKVLLLTPTKLFRQYSAELIKRYQLSDVYNCSIADLYRNILSTYDARFKDRQYIYQITEEYLPNGYLLDVYEEDNLLKIEAEINNAIRKYVQTGCSVLGIAEPINITATVVDEIIMQLDEQMKAFDILEEALLENNEYQDKRHEYEQLLKNVKSDRKKQQRYTDELQRIQDNQAELERLSNAVIEAEQERTEWINQREKRIVDAIKELETISKKVERGTDLQAPAKYARQLFLVKDLTEGKKFREDEEYLVFLNDYCGQAQADLQVVIKNKNIKNITDRYKKRKQEVAENLETISEEIVDKLAKVDEFEEWLRTAASETEGVEAKNTLLRSEMERARYFLARIESAVFEQEIWKALTPVKEKYDIQTLKVEELKDGKRKESRILYKSDLLFYVRIYMKLHPDAEFPDYSLICIDEGQDLHRADYDILHALYPKATFNIFGDVDQVLHSACGISNWEEQTGISTVYTLMTNYRNTAAIVDFCNKQYGINMNYVGSVDQRHKPVVLVSSEEIRDVTASKDVVVIVKDRRSYEEFCKDAGMQTDSYIYMDTISEKNDEKQKECYSIFAAKGLEFANVLVYAKHMTKNQKVVACTRSMGGLYYYE